MPWHREYGQGRTSHTCTTTTRVVGQISISSSNLGRGRLTHLCYGSILPQQAKPFATTADALLSETCKAAQISTTTQRKANPSRDRPATQVRSGWWQVRRGGSSGPPTILLAIRVTFERALSGRLDRNGRLLIRGLQRRVSSDPLLLPPSPFARYTSTTSAFSPYTPATSTFSPTTRKQCESPPHVAISWVAVIVGRQRSQPLISNAPNTVVLLLLHPPSHNCKQIPQLSPPPPQLPPPLR